MFNSIKSQVRNISLKNVVIITLLVMMGEAFTVLVGTYLTYGSVVR